MKTTNVVITMAAMRAEVRRWADRLHEERRDRIMSRWRRVLVKVKTVTRVIDAQEPVEAMETPAPIGFPQEALGVVRAPMAQGQPMPPSSGEFRTTPDAGTHPEMSMKSRKPEGATWRTPPECHSTMLLRVNSTDGGRF